MQRRPRAHLESSLGPLHYAALARCAALLIATALSACGHAAIPSRSSVADPRPLQLAETTVRFPNLIKATPAPPFDPSAPASSLGKALPDQPWLHHWIRPPGAVPGRGNASAARHTMSSVTNCSALSDPSCYTTGQQVGGDFNSNFDDIYGNISAYTSAQASLPAAPSNPNDYPNSISDMLHAGLNSMDGTTNCLEAGSVYETWPNSAPEANFEIGDFCHDNSGTEYIPYDHDIGDLAFQSAYVRDLGDGYPEVTVELYQPYGGDGYWHAIIYNYGANPQRWDTLYETSADPVQSGGQYYSFAQNGWTLFETHLFNGPCPTVPNQEETSIQVAVETGADSQNYFRNAQAGDFVSGLPSPFGGSCFQDDGTGIGAVYNFQWTSTYYSWRTTDPTASISPDASATYTCSYDDIKLVGKCSQSSSSDWTYATPSNTQVDSTHQIAIQLNAMSNNGSCGDGLSYTVSLLNPSGTTVYTSATETTAGFFTSYSGSAATGSWKWVVHANNQAGACGGNISSAGTYNDTATGSGSVSFST